MLPNVEHGYVNCTSITITRVGFRLRYVLLVRCMNKNVVFDQVSLAIEQLHTIGDAHCDICVDNVFIDSVEAQFSLDLESRCRKDEKPSTDIRGGDQHS
jgi:hypothetical protein